MEKNEKVKELYGMKVKEKKEKEIHEEQENTDGRWCVWNVIETQSYYVHNHNHNLYHYQLWLCTNIICF